MKTILLVGEPNWEECKVLAQAAAINSSNSESLREAYHSNCIGLFSFGGKESLNLTKSLHIVRRYHALSGFFAISNSLNLSQRANITKMWESGQQIKVPMPGRKVAAANISLPSYLCHKRQPN
ncbi:probable apyrase 7 [Olea europaea subsp. europaea]|uniref:Probable apyrase 7 n=1 Tax=Olea europaea subsp. europaea TaxID=158383 RepID=A0A8S0PQ42_OLEEU|nr:probable apyrase 7 [Olea europaea subsp. europaea]